MNGSTRWSEGGQQHPRGNQRTPKTWMIIMMGLKVVAERRNEGQFVDFSCSQGTVKPVVITTHLEVLEAEVDHLSVASASRSKLSVNNAGRRSSSDFRISKQVIYC
ncbi:hypothetical protein Tcan_17513 [Toxocara canis]|uniref:Uncharacterized protein n=1 Tax=Toxocara canis TaxID=6265 RepID=A0A0B2V8H0_TOXCA|nr:hypothetical protein Tcan_17513 [Toxocara canis]